jgi:chromosomal replication initiator protein
MRFRKLGRVVSDGVKGKVDTSMKKINTENLAEVRVAWKSVLKELKNFFEKPQYDAWFSDLQFVYFDDATGTIVVSTSDSVKKFQIEGRYKPIIIDKAGNVIKGVRNMIIMLDREPDDIVDGSDDDNALLKEKNAPYRLAHGLSRGLSDLFDDVSLETEDIPDPRYTFDTFVVGDNSCVAYGAALAVAENADKPNLSYNPLFIYGDSELDTTHLMHAIRHYVKDHYPKLKVRYVSSKMFTDDLANALQTNTFTAFNNKYHDLDLLMIEDIQFIEENPRVAEEIFYIYNTLYDMGKQLVFSSDRPPGNLNLEDRLKSRLMSGLPVKMEAPAFETKVAILRNKALLQNIPLTDGLIEVIDIIADRIKTNVREMEGALNRVAAFSILNGEPINKEMANAILKDIISGE